MGKICICDTNRCICRKSGSKGIFISAMKEQPDDTDDDQNTDDDPVNDTKDTSNSKNRRILPLPIN